MWLLIKVARKRGIMSMLKGSKFESVQDVTSTEAQPLG